MGKNYSARVEGGGIHLLFWEFIQGKERARPYKTVILHSQGLEQGGDGDYAEWGGAVSHLLRRKPTYAMKKRKFVGPGE